jgi:hypothetical protein
MKSVKKLYHNYVPAKILMDCIDGKWDTWRDYYEKLTPSEITWIYSCLHHFVGEQAHFDLVRVIEAINLIFDKENKLNITELGCWKGHLAKLLLEIYDENKIGFYTGYDLDHYAIETNIVDSPRFAAVKLYDWWHNLSYPRLGIDSSSVMLSCHTIEHFNDYQLKKILFKCSEAGFKYLIWELPFCQDRGLKNWYGTNNTHILNIDSTVFQFVVKACGYDFFYHEKTSEGHMFGMEIR